MQLSPRGRIVLALTASALLFGTGFALASSKLLVGVESVTIGSDGATIVYTSNEPADFSCSLGTVGSPCGSGTTRASTVYQLRPGTYGFTVVAENTSTDVDAGSSTYRDTASTIFTVPQSATTPPPGPPTHPDLALAIEGHNQAHGLTAHVVVTNNGDRSSRPTVAYLQLAGVRAGVRSVPGLAPRHAYRLTLTMPAPRSVYGQEEFTATVAPVRGETSTADNSASQLATFPTARPDLRIAIENHKQDGRLTADVVVRNVGARASPATKAYLKVGRFTSATRRVRALSPNGVAASHLSMIVPDSIKGSERWVSALVTRVPGEAEIENNRDRQLASFPVEQPSPAPQSTKAGGTAWWPISAGLAGAALLGGILVFVLRGRLTSSQKLDWQLEATEGELPQHCAVGQRICRRETKLTPKARRLSELTCARETESGRALTIKGKAVDHLNAAHAAHLERRQEEAETLVAVAEAKVWQEMSAWLDQGAHSAVHLDATFEGSKADCTFKLFECTEGKRPSQLSRIRDFLGLEEGDSPWHERARWKAEIKDVVTVDVGTLDAAVLSDVARRPVAEDRLRAHLLHLAERWTAAEYS